MAEKSTSKRGKHAGGNPITTGSPTSQEELEREHIAENMGTGDVPDQQPRKKQPPVHNVPMPQNRNSKHTGRSPRTGD